MGQREKLIIKILSGAQDNNIPFEDTCSLLTYFGFEKRTKGSHRIFYKDKIEDIINLQSKDGKVKNYQVKQIRNAINKYKLWEGNADV